MDSHGNVSEKLAKYSDIITCYRKAHILMLLNQKKALDDVVDRLKSGKGKPKYKAWIPVPILLP